MNGSNRRGVSKRETPRYLMDLIVRTVPAVGERDAQLLLLTALVKEYNLATAGRCSALACVPL